jgi:hypothetical protein
MKFEINNLSRAKITKNSRGYNYEVSVYGKTSEEIIKKLKTYCKKIEDFIVTKEINVIPRARKKLNKTTESE